MNGFRQIRESNSIVRYSRRKQVHLSSSHALIAMCVCGYLCCTCIRFVRSFIKSKAKHIDVGLTPAQYVFDIKRMFRQITVNGCESFWSTVIAFRLPTQMKKHTHERPNKCTTFLLNALRKYDVTIELFFAINFPSIIVCMTWNIQ